MPTKLCIRVSSPTHSCGEELEFLYNQEWTADSEALLLQRVHDILSIVRKEGKSLKFSMEIEVADPGEAIFLIKKKLGQNANTIQRQHNLSIREIEVLGLIMQGFTNHEIASKLFVSYETVKSHRKNILTKTGSRNTAALINYYHQTFFEK